jgi:class 3 adenylate cyclase/KaiC/GvpD/RAD55 family RecA-like ATPase
VLFTDLVGSTELRVRLGEDAANELRRTHDRLLGEAIAAHGGTVVKGLGDGLLATFHSAAEAVAGAIAVQQAAEAHSRTNPALAFSVRVGTSIGDVSTEDGDVFGVPVVEAARLCAAAGTGEILAADLVRALSRGRADVVFEPMGALELKGLPDPLDACRVVWEPMIVAAGELAERAPMPPALLGAVTSYVGRDALRSRLLDEWRAVGQGECRTVLLAGEPGVGKTRTAAETARVAYADGAVVLYGRSDEDLAVPYQPFVEALEHYAWDASAPVLGRLPGELVRLVPTVADHVGPLPAVVASDPASEEYRLYEAVASWLVEASRSSEAGLVLVVDDIHWATKPTLRLLQHAVRTAVDEHAPILVIATYRDTDIDRTHPLAALLGDLRRLPHVERLAVDNLNNAEVIELIEVAAGQQLEGPIRHLADVIYSETEGNPFFVGEVVRHLIETGSVRREGDRWVAADPDHVSVPEGVRDVIGRRLSRLAESANAVLSVAAVLGRDFDIEPLIDVVDLDEEAVLDALDVAMRARLIEETAVDRYRFAHALVRTTLYEELSATRRRRLHRRVADVLEKLRPDDVRALAFHCTEAGADGGSVERALKYTLAAAEESLHARAFADAEAGFRAALELCEDSPDAALREHVVALCGLGEAQRDQGDPAFRQTLLDAARRAVEMEDIELLSRAVLANSRGYASNIGGVDAERLVYVERAVEMVGTAPTERRARLLAQLAQEIAFAGDLDRRRQTATEAEQLARSIGDPLLVGDVLVATQYAMATGPDWRMLTERAREAAELADASADPTRRVAARIFLAGALLTAADIDAANAVTVDAVEIADRDGAPLIQWAAHANHIRLLVLDGRLDDADAENNATLARAQEMEQVDGPSWWGATTVGVAWLRGHAGYLADAVRGFAAQYPLTKIWRCAEAWVLAEGGRGIEARTVIDEWQLEPADVVNEPWPFAGSMQLAIAAWYLDDAELGRAVVEVLAPFRECWAHYYLVVQGPITWALGMANAAAGDLDAAVTDLAAALDAVSERGYTVYVANISLQLAQVLMRRGRDGDLERARALLAHARSDAERTGAGGVVERVDRALAELAN